MPDAIHALFNHPGLRSILVKLRVPLIVGVAIALIVSTDPRWLWPGFILSMLGELLQFWCFATLDKNDRLCSSGPYAVVRNPMYLGRFLLIAGALLATGKWWLLIPFVVLYWFYMVNRVKREEKRLRGIFGAEYAAYCAAVERFLPGWRNRSKPIWIWNAKLLRQNHGDANLAATLAFWSAVFLWHLPPS